LLEAAVKCRRHAWQHREVTLDTADWPLAVDQGPSSHARVEQRDDARRKLRVEIERAGLDLAGRDSP
jgi:hypothetical protein